MYREATSGIVKRHKIDIVPKCEPLGATASILPEYSQLGSSILPQYSQIGVVQIPEQTIVGDPYAAERKAAIMAGVLFFAGITLGYIWGGATGGVARAR